MLECTGQKSGQPEPFLSNNNNNRSFSNSLVEDPLKSPAAAPSPDLEASNQQHPADLKRPLFVDIVVGGMTCTMCSQAITRALSGMDGVRSVTVSLSTDVAHVEIDRSRENRYANFVEEIQDMISDIGYMVVDVITMPNKTLTPANNADTSSPSNDPSPAGAAPESTMEVNLIGGENTQQDRWNLIARRQEEKLHQRKQAFLWSLIGTVPILLFTMILPHILPHSMNWWERQHVHLFHKSIPVGSLVLWLLATPVQFICGWEFYRSSYFSLFRTGTLGMDVLVVLGTTASYGYALYATLSNQSQEAHFFETSSVLVRSKKGGFNGCLTVIVQFKIHHRLICTISPCLSFRSSQFRFVLFCWESGCKPWRCTALVMLSLI